MNSKKDQLGKILDACLDLVLKDGGSVESCLGLYPEHAAELEPLLRMALETRQALDYTPSAASKAKARMALHEAERQGVTRRLLNLRNPFEAFSARLAGPYKWAVSAAAALLLVVIGSTGMVAASSGSLPDQPLYQVKRAVEVVRLAVTLDNHAKARLHANLADRRAEEMAIMATGGRERQIDRLASALEHHLQEVQRNAVPGAGQMADETRLSPAEKERLRLLNQRLQDNLKHQETLLAPALQNAPQPAREELEKARQTTQDRYRALIKVIEALSQEEPAGVTPQK